MGTAIAGREQSTGKANQQDYRGKGIERMDLDLELGRVGRQYQELLGDSTHLEEVGRRMLHLMIQGVQSSEGQEFGARSSCPQVGGVGKHPRGEGRRLSEWGKKTIDPGERVGTWETGVVGRELKRVVQTRRNAEERAVLVH